MAKRSSLNEISPQNPTGDRDTVDNFKLDEASHRMKMKKSDDAIHFNSLPYMEHLLEKMSDEYQQNSLALDSVLLLMASKNITHLVNLLKDDTTPDPIKVLICEFFIHERNFEVNGLVGTSLMSIAKDIFIRYSIINFNLMNSYISRQPKTPSNNSNNNNNNKKNFGDKPIRRSTGEMATFQREDGLEYTIPVLSADEIDALDY